VWKADAERLACELEVDQFFAETGHIWTFDEGEPGAATWARRQSRVGCDR
jgi:hypothetical protein